MVMFLKLRVQATVALAAIVVSAGAAAAHHRVLTGRAAYYANQYVGQTMACGGTYRHYKMVAAHPSLDCGTRVRVTNKANGRRVTVTVRDRGAYGDEIMIDLSRGAAEDLGFVKAGTTEVRAVILHD